MLLPLQGLVAREYPVQVTAIVTPPYSLYLSDYASPESNFQVILNLRELDRPEYRVKLRVTIEGMGITLRTRPSYVPRALRKDPFWLNRVSSWTDEGLEVASEGRILKEGSEVGRIVGDRLHVKYTGYGDDIICDATKTTTGIGKYNPPGGVGTKQIIDSKLSKSGENPGGINILNDTRNTQGWSNQKIWDEINQPWLDDAIARGDNIRAVSDPLKIENVFSDITDIPTSVFSSPESLATYLKNLNNADIINQLSFYGREIRHLSQNNYLFNATSKAFVK